MNEQNPNPEAPEGMKVLEPGAPAEPKERTIEDDFPLTDFKDNILVLFKHVFQGNPVSLRVNGNAWLAEDIMKGGRHSVSGANGHAIVFNGNDVLWAECVTAQENRQQAIEKDLAEKARAVAEDARKAAKEKADAEAKEKAEAQARAKAEAAKKPWWKKRG